VIGDVVGRNVAIGLLGPALLVLCAGPTASDARAATPVKGASYYGGFGSESVVEGYSTTDAGIRVARSGRRLLEGRDVSWLAFECTGFAAVPLARRDGQPIRVRRDGSFSVSGRRGRVHYRVSGRFPSRDRARLRYRAVRISPRGEPGRCLRRRRVERGVAILYRNGDPPFPDCRTAPGGNIAESAEGRVFSQWSGGSQEFFTYVFGCRYDANRRFMLGRNWDDERIGDVRLAGPYVAWAGVYCSISWCNGTVERRDLLTGRKFPFIRPSDGPYGPTGVTDVELKENASVAWIMFGTEYPAPENPTPVTEVWALDSQGRRKLDAGFSIDRDSLTLSGSTITWIDGGNVETAELN
jgi:hypothetical protein